MIEPAWSEADLGMPMPDKQHACSVSLPTWNSVLGYKQGLKKIIRRIRSGNPRHFNHSLVSRLLDEASDALASAGEQVVLFPNKDAAQRAQRFVERHTASASRVASYEGLQALILAAVDLPVAMDYWRYSGEIVTSRQAARICNHSDFPEYNTERLRERLAEFGSYKPENIFLYESGMSGIFAVHRAVRSMRPGKKTLQLEFPSVDLLKMQNNFGNGVVFLNRAEGESLAEALRRIRQGEFAAVYCEAPSNPLLRTVDLASVSNACREGGVPFVVDDTACTVANIRVDHLADVVVTGLTEWISGRGDVSAGQVMISEESSFSGDFLDYFARDCPMGSRLYATDARILARNMSHFPERIAKINESAQKIAEFLNEHPAVEQVWYPEYTTPDLYSALRREQGGYGGLISFVLKSRRRSAKFYDQLKLCKGPGFGREFTLVYPYVMHAHFGELDWAEGCGIDRHLLRISVGVEEYDVIKNALEDAIS